MDNIIYFKPLGIAELKQIFDLQLVELNDRLAQQGKEIEVSDEAKELLLNKDYNYEYGARPLRRLIQNHVEDQISEKLVAGIFDRRKRLRLVVKNGDVAVV
ncbi:MAG: hypothetical protein LBV04_01305 [Deferribacteraceae bacterium]|nr:hypothetical protein [Deferribacteraceae bacterium]